MKEISAVLFKFKNIWKRNTWASQWTHSTNRQSTFKTPCFAERNL